MVWSNSQIVHLANGKLYKYGAIIKSWLDKNYAANEESRHSDYYNGEEIGRIALENYYLLLPW